ncbi:hypothetical protein P153DRAFT_354742 [Dothidotthia symphoricarpi CBS 119687]|uniref:Uncharacterized protein n=1 Tax=Dothidotthia symphoricarpi CBS 119687 TaxID=1392245 RepID=A0A6A6ANM7_9PLEO|nr:uncharacterized protein P153DRAFT_354742 [Dothidotthia symphoricarpi CBS 119687]KAF2132091.1 hypothetical protein P153DRAFT_354742 [Dothidotthia symphoricarpi CBS 119687]
MFSRLRFFCTLLTTILASPVDRELPGIQCRCLSLSMDTTPSACTILGFQSYSWQTAQSLAFKHNLRLEFASQATISHVMSTGRPMSDLVLWAVSHGEADLSPAKERETENKMICGYGDEVRKMSGYGGAEPQTHGLGQVLGVFMLLVAAYVAGEYVWTRYREGSIKLGGEERRLTSTAGVESEKPSTAQSASAPIDRRDNSAPWTFS